MIRCPGCGGGMELVVELRRRFAPELVSAVEFAWGLEVSYEGYGDQIADVPDYLLCVGQGDGMGCGTEVRCGDDVSPEEEQEFQAVLRAALGGS